jgi:hypothetical protein
LCLGRNCTKKLSTLVVNPAISQKFIRCFDTYFVLLQKFPRSVTYYAAQALLAPPGVSMLLYRLLGCSLVLHHAKGRYPDGSKGGGSLHSAPGEQLQSRRICREKENTTLYYDFSS